MGMKIDQEQKVQDLTRDCKEKGEKIKQISSQLSSCDADRQQSEHKLKLLTVDHRKLNNKFDLQKNKIKRLEDDKRDATKRNKEIVEELENNNKQLKTEIQMKIDQEQKVQDLTRDCKEKGEKIK